MKIHRHRALDKVLGVGVVVVEGYFIHKFILCVKSIWVYFSNNMLFPAFASYYYCKKSAPAQRVDVIFTNLNLLHWGAFYLAI